MMIDSIENIKELLVGSKRIVILAHVNPDGDAIGSLLGLKQVLFKLGHAVSGMVPNNFPSFLEWMPGASDIIIYNKDDKAREVVLEAEIVFCLDFNAPNRVADIEKCLIESKATKIMIDHHPNPKLFCDYTISITETSSTAELIYDFILAIGAADKLDRDIASCIYVGMATDTGSFSFSCNYSSTYSVLADLVKQGIVCSDIHNLVYNNYTETRMRLLGFCLSEKLVILDDYSTAYISLSQAELKEYSFKIGDLEGIVNYAMAIKGIVVAAIFVEKKDHVKISFRSKGDVSVNYIASTYFNGGGHKNASGGKFFKPLKESILFFEKVLYEKRELIFNT